MTTPPRPAHDGGSRPIRPTDFSDTLRPAEEGIWFSNGAHDVSYPSGGHQSCFEVEPSSFWFRHRNRCITDLVGRHAPDGPIFDIGGGNGFVSYALNEAGFPTALVEPGGTGIANARRRGVETVIRSEAQAAGFRPSSLPAVGLFDVLEHIDDDVGMLRWLSDTMVAGGKLYLTVPALGWLWSNEDVHAGHFRRYTARGSVREAPRFRIRGPFMSYFFSPLVLPIFLIRSLPARLRIRQNTTGAHAASEHSPTGESILTTALRPRSPATRVRQAAPLR